jgi:hypothetical protein
MGTRKKTKMRMGQSSSFVPVPGGGRGRVFMFVGGQKNYSERKRKNTKKAVTF